MTEKKGVYLDDPRYDPKRFKEREERIRTRKERLDRKRKESQVKKEETRDEN